MESRQVRTGALRHHFWGSSGAVLCAVSEIRGLRTVPAASLAFCLRCEYAPGVL